MKLPGEVLFSGADSLLPSQMSHAPKMTGEQRLMIAVLDDAVSTLLRYKRMPHERRAKAAAEEVQGWLDGDPARISFTMICERFDYEPEILRRAIRRLT